MMLAPQSPQLIRQLSGELKASESNINLQTVDLVQKPASKGPGSPAKAPAVGDSRIEQIKPVLSPAEANASPVNGNGHTSASAVSGDSFSVDTAPAATATAKATGRDGVASFYGSAAGRQLSDSGRQQKPADGHVQCAAG